MNPFEMPEGWEPPSERIQNLAEKIIKEIISSDLKNRIETEILLTFCYSYNGIHFKMYLN